MSMQSGRRVGVAFVGMGGAVATTAIAGIEMIKSGSNRLDGLPLAGLSVAGMADYKDLVFGGWDLNGDDLATAASGHGVLSKDDIEDGAEALKGITPWPAVGSAKFCKNIDGQNRIVAKDHREAVSVIANDLRRFQKESNLDDVVVVNLASTERWPDLNDPTLNSTAAFEKGLDSSDEAISPAMLYAYAAIKSGIPLRQLHPERGGRRAGASRPRQGTERSGRRQGRQDRQTMMKTVLAPAFKARALHVDGWFSTNILGNRDGLALNDPNSLQSKLNTKGTVLDSILGYPVEDHLVHIHYYRPRGDDKEAWDNIDVTGFMGQRMQVKVNFLCKDSILAAPLVIEIARVLDLAHTRGDGGVQEQLSTFFKAPMVKNGRGPEHAFGKQEQMLRDWLGVH